MAARLHVWLWKLGELLVDRRMRLIRDDARASTGDIAEALGMARPTAIKLLRAMQDVDLIAWVGNSPAILGLLETTR